MTHRGGGPRCPGDWTNPLRPAEEGREKEREGERKREREREREGDSAREVGTETQDSIARYFGLRVIVLDFC